MATFDVTVIGSLNLDVVARAPRLPRPGETVLGDDFAEIPGGKGLNQAVAAARAGASVAFVGAVGDDAAGALLRGVVRAEGIDDGALATVPGTPSGRALIGVDADAENSIVVVPGANARVAVPELAATSVVLAQLEIPAGAVRDGLRAARAAGATTVLNPAPADRLPDGILDACDIVVPNEHELALLGGVDALRRQGVGTIVVTRGAAGVDVVTADGTTHVEAFAVEAVDTTGAGDAFCGALASRLAAGDELVDAARFACAAGALATTRHGAVPSIPTRSAIEELLGRGRPHVAAGDEATAEVARSGDAAPGRLRPRTPRWTHVALRVADIDASIAWYQAYTPLELLDKRQDDDGYGAWLGHADSGEHPFILVLAQFFPDRDPFAPAPISTLAPFNHFGIELPTRDGVDAVAARGEAAGCLTFPPQQMPDPIGYICMLADPDGNLVEFSYDQGVYEKVRETWG